MTVAGELILGRSFEAPDETRTYYKLVVELVSLGELIVSRHVYEPGWRWSDSIWPLVRPEGCQDRHAFYMVSGAHEGAHERRGGTGVRPRRSGRHSRWSRRLGGGHRSGGVDRLRGEHPWRSEQVERGALWVKLVEPRRGRGALVPGESSGAESRGETGPLRPGRGVFGGVLVASW